MEVLFFETSLGGTCHYRRRQSGGTQVPNEAYNIYRWHRTGEQVKSPKIDPVPALVIDGQHWAQFGDPSTHRVKVNHLGFDKFLGNIFVGQILRHKVTPFRFLYRA